MRVRKGIVAWLCFFYTCIFSKIVHSFIRRGFSHFSSKSSSLLLSARQKVTMATHSNVPEIPESFLKSINAWCGLHGLMYTDGKLNWYPAPISLVPNRFSRSAFEFAQTIQPIWNKLIDRISRDKVFLVTELQDVVKADDFTKRVFDIYLKIDEDTLKNSLQFGIFRSDYMLNNDKRLLQVEINTIAASFGCLSKKVVTLHQHLLNRYPPLANPNPPTNPPTFTYPGLLDHLLDAPESEIKRYLQENSSLERLAAALAAAHRVSGKGEGGQGAGEGVIIFIVQPNERNQGDQRALEERLWEGHKVRVEFLTLAEAHARLTMHPHTQDLVLHPTPNSSPILNEDGEYECGAVGVSVVYYRAGYTPVDYPSEVEWEARERIEMSNAIKCPNVGYHLAGTKAIQAALCKPAVLEKYLREDECALLRQCFATQFALGDEEQRKLAEAEGGALEEAMKDGCNWVLKPQREGGGNNFYGAELSAFLKTHQNSPLLQGYVLMQRIFPHTYNTCFYRAGGIVYNPSISELGVYGAYLGWGAGEGEGGVDEGEGSLLNEYCGYLLRTKAEGVDEGGVATGYSVLNSITLIDE